MNRFSKMLGAGVGAAIAKPVVFIIKTLFPEMDQATLDSIEYLLFIILSGGATYIAPANKV